MKVSMFSLDDNNFCKFMTSHLPKPMFLAQFHPGLVGAMVFYFLMLTFGPLGPFKGPPGSAFGPLESLGALLVLHLGPLGP